MARGLRAVNASRTAIARREVSTALWRSVAQTTPGFRMAFWTALALASVLGWETASYGSNLANWDWLFVSGVLTVVFGALLTMGRQSRFDLMLDRLLARGVLTCKDEPINEEHVARLKEELEGFRRRSQVLTGTVFAISIAVALLLRGKDLLLVVELALAVPAGWCVGSFLNASWLTRVLKDQGILLRPMPGHLDGAAGLKPFGDYFFYQAAVLSLPAVFLGVWLILFKVPYWNHVYGLWQGPYIGLLAIAIGIEILGFVAPLWWVHVEMKTAKRTSVLSADSTLGVQLAEARINLGKELDPAARSALREQVEDQTRVYEEYQAMPTWPVDRKLLRRLTIGNLALAVSLVTEATAFAAHWTKL